jgi:hypothetical protein
LDHFARVGFFFFEIGEHDIRAFFGECDGYSASNATVRTSNYGALSIQLAVS